MFSLFFGGETFKETIFGFLLFLDSIVYSLISYIYQIFLVLTHSNDLIDTQFLNGFMNRLYLVIGVVMLFVLAYSLLKAMVNPDEALKGKKSPVAFIRDAVISIVLIAFVPTIFSFAFEFQNSILMNGTIGKLILGNENINSEDEANNTISEGGFIMSSTVLNAFLHINHSFVDDNNVAHDYCDNLEEELNSETYNCEVLSVYDSNFLTSLISNVMNIANSINRIHMPLIAKNGEIATNQITELLADKTTYGSVWADAAFVSNSFFNFGLFSEKIVSGEISYYPVISTLVGVFVVFVLISYTIDIAIRLVKLAVYELIAPIPILARMLPNEQANKVFSNWLKATLTTFAEVFIRVALLYFAVALIRVVVNSFDNIFSIILNQQSWGGARFDIMFIAQALVVVGIIYFIKQAPAIIKEITGLDGGKYSPVKAAMQSLSMVGGGITGAVRNFNDVDNGKGVKGVFNRFRSGLGGLASGFTNSAMNRDQVKDFKSMKSVARNSGNKAFQRHQERIAYAKQHEVNGVPRFITSTQGHIKDKIDKVSYWATGNVDESRLQQIVDLAKSTGKGASDELENYSSVLSGYLKEKKRQLDALKTTSYSVMDYYDTIDVNGTIKYVPKGSNKSDPTVIANAIEADVAQKNVSEQQQKLFESAKNGFEEDEFKAIASLYTNDAVALKKYWNIDVNNRADSEKLKSFKTQFSNKITTLEMNASKAQQLDSRFSVLKTLDVEKIMKEQNLTSNDAVAKALKNAVSGNKANTGGIQADAEMRLAEAKLRSAKINADKKSGK